MIHLIHIRHTYVYSNRPTDSVCVVAIAHERDQVQTAQMTNYIRIGTVSHRE